MRKERLALLAMGLVAFALIFSSCGGGGDGGGWYACSYESRHSGCGDSVFTDWVAECFSFNSEDLVISPEDACYGFAQNDYHCEAGCCVTSQFRYADLSSGDCP